MHLYGIRLIMIEITLCAIEIKISNIQLNTNLSKRKSSIALNVNVFIVLQMSNKYYRVSEL